MRYAYRTCKGHLIILIWSPDSQDYAEMFHAIFDHWDNGLLSNEEMVFLGNAVRLKNAFENKKRRDKNAI